MTALPTPETPSPWHSGEVAMQQTIGVAERMAKFGRKVIRDFLPDQHRDLYAGLPFLLAGTVDPDGDVWATFLTGEPGFAASPDPRTLMFAVTRDTTDPADAGMGNDDPIGLLGIELHTRRRNRVNGTVRRSHDSGFAVAVEHAFGNCPQYIQHRDWSLAPTVAAAGGLAERQSRIDDWAVAMISRADTFFVASYAETSGGHRQVDVSHRGGKAGFVRIDADGCLTIPDFAGNLHFNTLGNFRVNPRAGLVFVDFDTGDLLQMSGEVEVVLDSPEISAFQGAERLWRFHPRIVVRRDAAMPLRWSFREWSPNSLMTGSWDAAAKRMQANILKTQWRPLRITAIVDESAVIRSFQLEPADNAGLIPHRAGQHLPIRLSIPGETSPIHRTYTISTAPSDSIYRLSVKRQGIASLHLHDHLRVGDIIEARAPAGEFTIDAAERRPAVLMAAGVGVTPILAMLRHLVYEGLRTRRVRSTTVFYAARSRAERAFDEELAELVARAGGAVKLIRVLSVIDASAVRGTDSDAAGRLDIALLRQTLGFDDYDFYMCGPSPFMQSIYDGLRSLNIADARIHAEAFGPAGLMRRVDGSALAQQPVAAPATEPVPVAFTASGKEARWSPGGGSLLELAEARGLAPAFSCRSGNCGTCRTRIIEGAVAYQVAPTASHVPGHALICCAVPADKTSGGDDRLVLDI